jgi:hypothetical protein
MTLQMNVGAEILGIAQVIQKADQRIDQVGARLARFARRQTEDRADGVLPFGDDAVEVALDYVRDL